MLAALLTTCMFAVSVICGHRSAVLIGGVQANFWRISLAGFFLAIWTALMGFQIDLAALPYFMLSGFLGIGLGDTAYFQALPRLGSRRTALISQCLTAPFAALIEWVWLGTKLNLTEIGCIAIILTGVAIALVPSDHIKISARNWKIGIIASAIGALGGAFGVVCSRKAFAVATIHADAGTSGFERVLGGIAIPVITLLVIKWRSARTAGPSREENSPAASREKWRKVWPWVLVNSLAGQTLGVTFMQLALAHTEAAIVTAITATTPILLLPMTRWLDGEKICPRSIIGGVVGVGGVIGLTFARLK